MLAFSINRPRKCNPWPSFNVCLVWRESIFPPEHQHITKRETVKSPGLKFILVTSVACAFSLLASATPLKRAEVIAHPAWLLHLDCDVLRPTDIGQYILAEMDKPGATAKLATFQRQFHLDLRTQLHGMTLYGTSAAPEDGVLMIYADFDPAHLVSLAQAARDYQSSPHGQNVIHHWIDNKKPAKEGVQPRVYAAIQGNRVIFGKREESVAAVLDVLAGTTPNLASSNMFPELGLPDSTPMVEAAAQKMKLADSDPNAAILKLSQSVQLVLGESGKKFHGTLTLVADSDEVAGHILSIAQGLLALSKLQNDKPETVSLANAITIAQTGSRVTGKLDLSTGEVVQIMKADAARKAAKRAAKEAKE